MMVSHLKFETTLKVLVNKSQGLTPRVFDFALSFPNANVAAGRLICGITILQVRQTLEICDAHYDTTRRQKAQIS